MSGTTTAAPTSTDATVKPTIDISTLLNWGDLFSAATVSAIEYALGEKVTGTKAATAVAVSVVARVISTNFTTVSSLGGNIVEPETKDAFIVALLNAFIAMGMKRSVAKQVAIGVAGDVLSDRFLTMISMKPNQSVFKASTTPP